ncbi:hypothetical protein ASE35_03115 [Lysobacter sp. Root916]|uniref:J domain-containing protein n=1 Tax=Lysobacter sp. Root916 TaxID=1736606 RepID=UPI00070EBB4C|nr:J domain-containing protein [Lysobacter sp. Root916]KRD39364.1 hypothetical protein ASE35_03115 [Lysobacter sp. Root916]
MHVDPFAALGLDRDADERAIKRAYAQRLRTTRPDEDPVGFQRLNEAYQRCLAFATASLECEDEDNDEEFVEEPTVDASVFTATLSHDALLAATGEPPAQPQTDHEPGDSDRFDAQAFLAELVLRTRQDSARSLERWLRELPALYALDLKAALRLPVALEMSQADPPPRAANARAVVAFFGLDTVSPSDGWLYAQAAYVLRRAQAVEDYDYEIARLRSEHTTSVDRLLVRELEGPAHWLRRAFIALIPGLPSRTLAWWRHLSDLGAELAEERLDPKAVAFWQAATDRTRLDWRRALIGCVRAALYCMSLVSLIAMLRGDRDFLGLALRESGIVAAIWLLWISGDVGVRRMAAAIERRTPWDGPLTLALPCLAAALSLQSAQPEVSMLLSGMALIGWTSARTPATRRAMVLAGLFCGVAVLPTLGTTDHPAIAVAMGAAIPIATDVLYAALRRIPLREVRSRSAWLWPLFGLALATLMATSIYAP